MEATKRGISTKWEPLEKTRRQNVGIYQFERSNFPRKTGKINKKGYIFLILEQFATKLCNFTHFKMLFPAMVMVSFFLSRSKFRLKLESSIGRKIF
jgi:hypothetical protein